jgi:predicted transcriptional regulator
MRAAETIKKIRLTLLLEQSELGKKLSMSKQAIWHLEKGTRQPRIATIRKMINLAKQHKIKVTLEDFFD